MATYYASKLFTTNQGSWDRKQFSSYEFDGACLLVGGVDGIWVIEHNKAAYTIVIENYDESRHSEYVKFPNKPYMFIKCTADCSFFGNITIDDENGNTLYTFTRNCLVTPEYLVLTLDTAAGGFHTWKAA